MVAELISYDTHLAGRFDTHQNSTATATKHCHNDTADSNAFSLLSTEN